MASGFLFSEEGTRVGQVVNALARPITSTEVWVSFGDVTAWVAVLADVVALFVDIAKLLDPRMSQYARSDGQGHNEEGEDAQHPGGVVGTHGVC